MSKQAKRWSPTLRGGIVCLVLFATWQSTGILWTVRINSATVEELRAVSGDDLLWKPPNQVGTLVSMSELELVRQANPLPTLSDSISTNEQQVKACQRLTDSFEHATRNRRLANADPDVIADYASNCYGAITQAYLWQAYYAAEHNSPKQVEDRLARIVAAYRQLASARGYGPMPIRSCLAALQAALDSAYVRASLSEASIRELLASMPPLPDLGQVCSDRMKFEFTTLTLPLIRGCADEQTLASLTLGRNGRWREFGAGEFDMRDTTLLYVGELREQIARIGGGRIAWDHEQEFKLKASYPLDLPEEPFGEPHSPVWLQTWDAFQFKREMKRVPNGLGRLVLAQLEANLRITVEAMQKSRGEIQVFQHGLSLSNLGDYVEPKPVRSRSKARSYSDEKSESPAGGQSLVRSLAIP